MRPGQEGGQMPLFRRLPKRGFNNANFRKDFAIVNLQAIEARFENGEEVTPESLAAKGLIPGLAKPVKVLGHGELTKKVTVNHFDPETIDSFERKFDRAFSKEALFTIENKQGLIAAIEQHLKPSGLFLLREFVLADESAFSDPAFKDWRDSETHAARRPFMVTSHGLVESLKAAGFIVRVNEDVTDEYIRLVNQGWVGADKVAESLAQRDDAEELQMTLLSEAEFWSRRVNLMEKGLLRVWRVLGSKRADKPSMLSDW